MVSLTLTFNSWGFPNDENFIYLAKLCGIFAILIFFVSTLFGSSILTALVVFITSFSAGAWLILALRNLVYHVNDLEYREMVVKEKEEKLKRERLYLDETIQVRLKHAQMQVQYTFVGEESTHTKLLSEFIPILTCPIMLEVPNDPVMTSTGQIYSSKALARNHAVTQKNACPLTRQQIKWTHAAVPITQLCQKVNKYIEGLEFNITK